MNHRAAPRFTNILHLAALAALAVALFGLPSKPALAQGSAQGSDGSGGLAQGFSVGGGVGEYNLRINNAAQLGAALDSYSTHDTAYQLFVQYRFAPFLALEGQYMNLGTGSAFAGSTHITTKTEGWAPWLVATLPLGSLHGNVVGPFELFIKGGEYFYDFHDNYYTPTGVIHTESNSHNHFVYGGGVGLVFIQRLDVRLEYDELHLFRSNTSNALWLTAAFNF